MFLKTIAQWWAKSNLEEETARTQSMIRELDRAKAEAIKRIEAKRSDYLHKIKAHQEKRDNEQKIYIDFMNDHLKIAGAYLPELKEFQNLTFTCVDSWIRVDLCQQEIDVNSEKRNVIDSTIGLLKAYMSELTKQSQRQGRYVWREFTAARDTVENDFVDKTKRSIERASKSNDEEFKSELRRLKSHRDALLKDSKVLQAERSTLFENKKKIADKHDVNKKAQTNSYNACLKSWEEIARKFESYYVYEPSKNHKANEWLRGLENGGTLPEIIEVIGMATESIKFADHAASKLCKEYEPYKLRFKEAHASKNYTDSFAIDKAERARLEPQVRKAIEKKNSLVEARAILFTRRNELLGYIDRIKPLYPDAVLESLCEMLNVDREFNSWRAFGFNAKNQRREHWEKKQKGIENATAN